MTLAEKVIRSNRPVIVSGGCEHYELVAAMSVNAGAR
jgi:hypothetical protein